MFLGIYSTPTYAKTEKVASIFVNFGVILVPVHESEVHFRYLVTVWWYDPFICQDISQTRLSVIFSEIWCQTDFCVKLDAQFYNILQIPKKLFFSSKNIFKIAALSRYSNVKNRGACHFMRNLLFLSNLKYPRNVIFSSRTKQN